jgi:hypothetical protein
MKQVIKDQITGEKLIFAANLGNGCYCYNDEMFDNHVIVRLIEGVYSHVVALRTSKLSKAIDYYNKYIA